MSQFESDPASSEEEVGSGPDDPSVASSSTDKGEERHGHGRERSGGRRRMEPRASTRKRSCSRTPELDSSTSPRHGGDVCWVMRTGIQHISCNFKRTTRIRRKDIPRPTTVPRSGTRACHIHVSRTQSNQGGEHHAGLRLRAMQDVWQNSLA
jgi:hypothetical protein